MISFLKSKAALAFVVVVCSFSGGAWAADQGTEAEAEAMVKRAILYIKANGQAKAEEEFTNGRLFKDRDLYVAWFQLGGKVLANGANPKLVGKDLIGLKDADGFLLVKSNDDLARTKGIGWSSPYKFLNPMTGKIAEKHSFIERVGDTWVAVGVYK